MLNNRNIGNKGDHGDGTKVREIIIQTGDEWGQLHGNRGKGKSIKIWQVYRTKYKPSIGEPRRNRCRHPYPQCSLPRWRLRPLHV